MKYKLIKKISNNIFLSEHKSELFILKNIKLESNLNKLIKIHKILENSEKINQVLEHSSEYLVFYYKKYTLLDFIELGVGMDKLLAQHFFKQIVDGVEFMHSKGICHRDLKPDNILVDENYNLIISDLDSATLIYAKCNDCFVKNLLNSCKCMKKEKRLLKSLVGSYEYMPPEQYECFYYGDTSDIWSMGIILLFCLTGTLSWTVPNSSDGNFKAYKQLKYHNYSLFNKIEFSTLKFLKKLLSINLQERISISEIKNEEFYKKEIKIKEFISKDKVLFNTQPNIKLINHSANEIKIKDSFISSQPIENSLKRIYLPVCSKELKYKMVEEYNFIEINKNELVWNDVIKMKINDINGMCCITFKKMKGSIEDYENALREFICELKQ